MVHLKVKKEKPPFSEILIREAFVKHMKEVWNKIATVQKNLNKIAFKLYHEQLGKERKLYVKD